MPSNVLTGIVKIEAPGAEAALEDVAKGADKAGRAMSELQKQVAAFGGGVNKFVPQITNLGKALNIVPPAVDKIKNSAPQATNALLNLGRVAQDAPFGFIGIANNINPLLESFQRLKATTGTTGGALKALGSSLLGPAGIGVAISVVSSLLIVFGDRLFGASKAAKEAEDANKKLAEGITDDLTKLTTLVGVIQNVTTSTEDRKKALQALNQEYGTYLDAMGKEEITATNVAAAYDRIVDALVRQAVVKGIQDEISKAVEETAKALIVLEKAHIKEAITAKATTVEGISQADQMKRAINEVSGAQNSSLDGFRDRNIEIKKSIGPAETFTDAQERLTAELKAGLFPLLQLTNNFEDLGIKLSEVKKKAAEVLTPKLTTGVVIEAQMNVKLGPLDLKQIPPPTQNQIDELSKLFKGFTVPIVLKPTVNITDFQRITKGIRDVITNNLTTAFDGFIDAVSAGANAFKAFGLLVKNIIKGIVTDLIKAIAKAAILSLLSGGGEKGISFIQALIGGLGRRAGGGPVTGGKGYIVGENGPEFFMPNVSGAIVPNGGTIGAQPGISQQGGALTARVYGRDLLFVLTQAGLSAGRTT